MYHRWPNSGCTSPFINWLLMKSLRQSFDHNAFDFKMPAFQTAWIHLLITLSFSVQQPNQRIGFERSVFEDEIPLAIRFYINAWALYRWWTLWFGLCFHSSGYRATRKIYASGLRFVVFFCLFCFVCFVTFLVIVRINFAHIITATEAVSSNHEPCRYKLHESNYNHNKAKHNKILCIPDGWPEILMYQKLKFLVM